MSLAVTVVLTLGVVLLSVIAYVGVWRRLAGDLDRTLLEETSAFAAAIGKNAVNQEQDLVSVSRAYLRGRATREVGAHPILLVRLAAGKTLSNSSLPIERANENSVALNARTAVRAFLTIRSGGKTFRVATVPITDPDGRTVGVFEAALSTGPSQQVASELGWTLFAAGMAVVLVGAAFSARVAKTSLAPLSRAAATARQTTRAHLTARVPYEGPDDEVGQMVESLNAMLDRLEEAFGEQRRFVADASHELRTPLAVVKGHLEMARGAGLTGEERQEAFAIVAAETDRMTRLVDDLLELARLDAGPARPRQELEVFSMLEDAALRARAIADARLELDCEGAMWVMGDPDQLMQALLNLLDNAAAHTPPGGTITVGCSSSAREVTMRVEDSGPGIKEADLARIFDRFYRSQGWRPRDSGGSGLGLAITKRLVELHGGRISAHNGPTGAVFEIVLPRIPAPETGQDGPYDDDDGSPGTT